MKFKCEDITINKKICGYIIDIYKGIKNKKSIEKPNIIQIDEGMFYYKNNLTIPQVVYGELKFEMFKKENKKLNAKEETLQKTVQDFVNKLRLNLDFDELDLLDKSLKGKEITKIVIEDDNTLNITLIEVTTKKDANNKNVKEYGDESVYTIEPSFYEPIPKFKEAEYGVDIDAEEIFSKSSEDLFEFEINDILLRVNPRTVVTGSKYHTVTEFNVIEEDDELATVELVSDLNVIDYDKAGNSLFRAHSLYRIVKYKNNI